jgi:predicted TIM-barrel fold metal-dependent hydrolase
MTSYRVISADSHVIEPGDLWLNYIDARFRERAPRLVQLPDEDVFEIEGRGRSALGLSAGAGRDAAEVKRSGRFETDVPRAAWDPSVRLEAIRMDGVEAEVLYPTISLRNYGLSDPGFLEACLEAYNRWLADFCRYDPARFKGIGMIALEDIDRSVAQLHRVRELGLAGAMIPLRPDSRRPYSSDDYDPFWAAAEALGLPITLHIATQRSDAEAFALGFSEWTVQTVHIQRSLAELIFGGVFDRFPGLRVVSAENDIGWIGNFLERMDGRFARKRYLYPHRLAGDLMPSEYFRRHVSATFMSDYAGMLLRDVIGVDNIMWASDYPHHESTWPHSQEVLAKHFAGVPEADRQKILVDNVTRLYQF